MKKFMKENWFKIGLLSILVIFIAGAFYWYGYRPRQIERVCENEAEQTSAIEAYTMNGQSAEMGYNFFIERCLRENGL
jgi:hypothetical protein